MPYSGREKRRRKKDRVKEEEGDREEKTIRKKDRILDNTRGWRKQEERQWHKRREEEKKSHTSPLTQLAAHTRRNERTHNVPGDEVHEICITEVHVLSGKTCISLNHELFVLRLLLAFNLLSYSITPMMLTSAFVSTNNNKYFAYIFCKSSILSLVLPEHSELVICL